MGDNHPDKHAEGINRGITDAWRVAVDGIVGIGQRHRVRHAATQNAADAAKVVLLGFQNDKSHYQHRHHGDGKAYTYPHQSLRANHRLEELSASLQTQATQIERQSQLTKQALDNITPQVEVKSRRIGGATFQVPTEIRPDRKESISMKNLIAFARKRGGKTMADKLAAEIMDAFNNQGGAYKRKEDMHRMAEANRAFAHFRF